MNKHLAVAAFFLLGLGLSGGMLLGRLMPAPGAPATVRTPPPVSPQLESLQNSFADVAAYVTPSVVHITNTETRLTSWWGPVEIPSVGSGVVVSEDGYVLTNAHVVARALGKNVDQRLVVRLFGGDEYRADVVGRDELSDIAVIKIASERKFAPATLGDSDSVRVGDWVLAIGSPFQLNHTVTAGIISAKSRSLGETPSVYNDYLQTDAAINPGNSGGALVNIKGEVIGINTAILNVSSVNVGVGFAIPVNIAKWVKDRLIRDGKIDRGFLGVTIMSIDENLVREFEGTDIDSLARLLKDLGLDKAEGVYVKSVQSGGPAAEAGLREGDVVVECSGKKVAQRDELSFEVAGTKPGTKVRVKIVRDKKPMTLDITVGKAKVK